MNFDVVNWAPSPPPSPLRWSEGELLDPVDNRGPEGRLAVPVATWSSPEVTGQFPELLLLPGLVMPHRLILSGARN